MYDVQGITFSYSVEGRDKGPIHSDGFGFLLPPDQIQPSAEENWAALINLCKYVAKHHGPKSRV